MAKYKIEIAPSLLNLKMRDLFKKLIDDYVEKPEKGYLKSYYANYGFVSFWYGWLDEEKLEKYYKAYVSESELERIQEVKESEGEELFSLRDQLHNLDYLFPITRDHPDVIGQGHAEVYLHVLLPNLDDVSLDDAVVMLRQQADKLEKIKDFRPEDDPALMTFIDDPPDGGFDSFVIDETEEEAEYSATAFEQRIRISFDGDDKLRTVLQRIDKVIEPLKGHVDNLRLYGGLPSHHPF